ncbi:hypothetical protein [Azospirillum argentinense]
MEEDSLALIEELLPAPWVIRDYKPDYGLDLAIEIFEPVDKKGRNFETLGAFIFAQVKSAQSVKKHTVKKYPRHNVEKVVRTDTAAPATELEIVKFDLDVSLINTVEAMGAANPVMLFLCDLKERCIYFLCINDYVEKVLRWERDGYWAKKKVTVEIPATNVVRPGDAEGARILQLYALRPKYYAAFSKFHYQKHELHYDRSPARVRHFLEIIRLYDIWDIKGTWLAMFLMKAPIDKLYEDVCSGRYEAAMNKFEPPDYHYYDGVFDEQGHKDVMMFQQVEIVWDQLCNLSRMYEEVVREWFLPTAMGHNLSGT